MRSIAILLVVGCGSSTEPPKAEPPKPESPKPESPKPESPKPESPKPDAPSAQPDLTVTLDGKPIEIRSVIAVDDGNDSIKIYFRNYGYSCKELIEGFSPRSSQDSDFDFDLRAGRYLHPDGKLGWAIRGKYLFGRYPGGTTTSQSEKQDGGDPIPNAELTPQAGKTFALPLDFEMKTEGSDKLPARTLVIKGTARVTGCGDSKFKKDEPPPAPQTSATVELAGTRIPIGGAGFVEKRDGRRVLELSTHEVKCIEGSDSTTTRADVALELEWDKAGKITSATRSGRWVDWAATSELPKLSGTPNRAPRGAQELAIALDGSTTIKGYSLTLGGTVKAIVCPVK